MEAAEEEVQAAEEKVVSRHACPVAVAVMAPATKAAVVMALVTVPLAPPGTAARAGATTRTGAVGQEAAAGTPSRQRAPGVERRTGW